MFGGEIDFRANFEAALNDHFKGIPIVTVVVEGSSWRPPAPSFIEPRLSHARSLCLLLSQVHLYG
jgi:hypothetical protein